MKTALVTVLGRAVYDPRTGYRRARYRFPDGTVVESSFFGLDLCRKLQPHRLVVVGTGGSSWHLLAERLPEASDANAWLDLHEAAAQGVVRPTQIAALEKDAAGHFAPECRLLLVGTGLDPSDPVDTLATLAQASRGVEHIALDVTHGLRHLPMLLLAGAAYLRRIRPELRSIEIWYGALELRDGEGIAPVLRLDGLTRILAWVEALAAFDHSGDYAVIAEHLEEEGFDRELADLLRGAAHDEAVLRLESARQRIARFLDHLGGGLPGVGQLFLRALRARLSWAHREHLFEHQRKLAFQALARGDFLRAAVLGFEAVVSRDLGPHEASCREARARARSRIEGEVADLDPAHPWRRAYHRLRRIRNTLAHGEPGGSRSLDPLLADPKRLRKAMEQDLHRLLDS